MSKLDLIWENVLEEIQPNVNKGSFVSLIKPTRLIDLNSGTATISTTSVIIKNMLQSRFKTLIEEAFKKTTTEEIRVIFTVVSPPAKEKEEDVPLFGKTEKPSITVGHLPRVRSDFTFTTLAVSDSNRLAFESSRTVAQNPGQSYNPLFIYGPVGVGKTHLMQAIANALYTKNPDSKIIYITSEEFTNEVVEAIRNNDTARMKRRFRTCNLLIIDDVQFIAGKDKVQEELFHTFNSLIDAGAQIVLSSDRPPSEIKKLEARLMSRFGGGLTVDVESPDFELRTAILLKKAEKFGYNLPIDVAKVMAEKEQDVRTLEGTLLRVITQAQATQQEITEELVTKTLGGIKKENHVLHADDVINVVCNFYQIKPTQLKGPKRDAFLVKPRQIVMYILLEELGLTLVEIGNILGGRDHTTVMHGTNKIRDILLKNSGYHEEITGITKLLRG